MNKVQSKSLLLTLLVIFSVIFQSFHMWEHSHEQDHKHSSKNSHTKVFSLDDDNSTCSICHFNINTDSTGLNYDLLPEKLITFYNLKIKFDDNIERYFHFRGLFRLRAPPALS